MKKLLICLMAMGLMTSLCMAQQDNGDDAIDQMVGPDPSQAKASDIFKIIPADSTLVVTAPNLKNLLSGVETFANQMGVGEQLQAVAPGGLLPMMAMSMGLGQGCNPNGGVGFVIPNLKKAGFDLKAFSEDQTGKIEPPIVILVAGKDAKKMFPNFAKQMDDGKIVVNLAPMNTVMKTKQIGDYLALSNSDKALALIGQGDSLAATAKGRHKILQTKGQLVATFDIQVLMAFQKAQIEKMQDMGGPDMGMTMAPMMEMMKMQAAATDQISNLTIAAYFAKQGVFLEEAVSYKPDSELGLAIAAMKPTEKLMLDRLPNQPYVLAASGMNAPGQGKMAAKQLTAMLEMILAGQQLTLPADLKARMQKLILSANEQILSAQFVGGAPAAEGLFGLAMVVECKDANKVKTLLNEKALLLTDLVQKTFAMKEEDLKSLKFDYKKNVATVSGIAVDVIEVTFDELTEMSDKDKGEMAKVIGEDKIRFLVAQTDPRTLVVTFGGSESFLAKAIEAAAKGGNLAKDAGIQEVNKLLPTKTVGRFYFSPKNLFATIQAGMKKMGEASNLPEGFAFQGTLPIAGVVTTQGAEANVMIYLPSSAAKDFYSWIMAEMAASMNGGGGQPMMAE